MTNLQEDLELYHLRHAHAHRLLRSSKMANWNQFLDYINSDTDRSTMRHKIKILNGTKSPPPIMTLKTNDGDTHDPVTASALLAEAFATVSSNKSYTEEFLKFKSAEEPIPLRITSDNNLEDYNQPITGEELHFALNRYIKNTVPGPHEITAAFLRHFPTQMRKKLLFTYNKIWQEKCFPSILLSGIIMPLPKHEKDGPTSLHPSDRSRSPAYLADLWRKSSLRDYYGLSESLIH